MTRVRCSATGVVAGQSLTLKGGFLRKREGCRRRTLKGLSGQGAAQGYAGPRVLAALAGQGLLLARAPHALRWRLETFGLYMPSLPQARPWWRVNARASRALLRQLPGYARWLAEMHVLRFGGARGSWRARTGTDARDWEAWLALSDEDV